MLAGAEGSMEDPGAAEGAAGQRSSSGSTHSCASFAVCPARMWGEDDVQLADDGGCLSTPDADQAARSAWGNPCRTRVAHGYPAAGRRAGIAPWAHTGGHHAPAGHIA